MYLVEIKMLTDDIKARIRENAGINNMPIGAVGGQTATTQQRHGSPTFYKLIEQMGEIHNKKSYDYASNDSPYANYQFAGKLSKLFNNPDDAGFIGRIAEKLYRLANLENNNKIPSNESVEDTEIDILTICALWMASRRDRRGLPKETISSNELNTRFIEEELHRKNALMTQAEFIYDNASKRWFKTGNRDNSLKLLYWNDYVNMSYESLENYLRLCKIT